MAASPNQPATTPKRGRRWFALLGGAVAWFVHLIGVFMISEFACVAGLGERQWWSVSAVALLLLAASLAPLLVAVAAALVGYRDARRDSRAPDPHANASWLSRAGWLFSALFALIIVVQSMPTLFYLAGC